MATKSVKSQLKSVKSAHSAFTLIEILIYTVIFAIVGGMLTGILINATRVEQRESASAEVTSQLNFVMQTIGRLVRESSNIEIEAGTATSTLKLRMRDSAKDPTYITLVSNAIKLQEGSSATTTLTSDRVVVNTLSFKKFTQYPGHDTVSIDLTMTYNTQNTAGQVQRTLSSAIARVSAATFDSDVLPGGTYNYNLGQTGSPWQKIIMADGTALNPSYTFGSDTGLGLFRAGTNILGFTTAGAERIRIDASGNVGIGTSTPSGILTVASSTSGASLFTVLPSGNVGIGTAGPNTALDINGALSVRGMSAPSVSPTGQGIIYFDSTANKFKVSENGGAYGDLGGGGGVPNGTIIFYNGGTCPAGWSQVSGANGRYIVGLNPASSTDLGLTAGTALSNLENRAVGQHGHGITDPGHEHRLRNFAYNVGSGGMVHVSWYGDRLDYGLEEAAVTGITVNATGTTAGTNAPYIQYLVCQYVGTGGSTGATTVPGYKYGLTVTYTNSNVVNVTATSLEVGGLLINSINVSPSLAASGANGLDTGSEAASTWYAVYVITNDAGTSVAGLYSTNFTTPTLPGGYTKSRRVGEVRNDGSSNIRGFTRTGNTVIFDLQTILLQNGTALSWTDVDASAVVPPTSNMGIFESRAEVSSGNGSASYRKKGSSDTNYGHYVNSAPLDYMMMIMPLDANRIMQYVVEQSAITTEIYSNGYILPE